MILLFKVRLRSWVQGILEGKMDKFLGEFNQWGDQVVHVITVVIIWNRDADIVDVELSLWTLHVTIETQSYGKAEDAEGFVLYKCTAIRTRI